MAFPIVPSLKMPNGDKWQLTGRETMEVAIEMSLLYIIIHVLHRQSAMCSEDHHRNKKFVASARLPAVRSFLKFSFKLVSSLPAYMA